MARLQPEDKNFFQISHVRAGTQALGPPSAFLDTLQGRHIANVVARFELEPIWDAGTAGIGFTYCVTELTLDPRNIYFVKSSFMGPVM